MCRSVRDAARYVDAIAGPTDIDPTSLPQAARPYEDARRVGRRGRSSCAASARRGRRRSASRCATPRSRSSRTKPRSRSCADAGIELVDVDVHFPQPGRAWGIISNTRRRRAITSTRARGQLRRRHAGVAARASRRSTRLDVRRSCCARCGAADELLARDRRRVRRGRPAAHADDRDDRVRGRRAAAVGDRGPAGRRHGLGAVHRAVQHLGQARGEHPGRHERPTGCPSACRSSPAATRRSSCSRAARSPRRTAPGPSSPRWRTPDR